MDQTERIARLEREIEVLKGEGKSTQVKPTVPLPKFDASAQLRLPPSVTREMTAAIGDKLVRDIVKDHLGRPTSLPTVPSRSPGKAGSNWIPERPLQTFGTERLGPPKEELK